MTTYDSQTFAESLDSLPPFNSEEFPKSVKFYHARTNSFHEQKIDVKYHPGRYVSIRVRNDDQVTFRPGPGDLSFSRVVIASYSFHLRRLPLGVPVASGGPQ